MSDMEHKESFERFVEGSKKAASLCRQLAAAQHNPQWKKVAEQIEGILSKGQSMYYKRALSEQEIESMLNKMTDKTNEELNG